MIHRRFSAALLIFLLCTLSSLAEDETAPYDRGLSAMSAGRYLEAFRLFDEASRVSAASDLDRGRALLQKALIAVLFSRYDDARACYEEALPYVGKSPDLLTETLLSAGINDMCRQDYDGARKYLEQGLKSAAGRPRTEILLSLGDLYFVQNKFNPAHRYYESAARSMAREDASFARALALDEAGEALQELKNMQPALLDYQQALQDAEQINDPALKARIYHHMGMLYHELGDDDEAVECFKNSVQSSLEPDGSLSPEERPRSRFSMSEPFAMLIPLLMENEKDEEAYTYCQLAKEREYLKTLELAFPVDSRDSQVPPLIRQERTLFYQIRALASEKRKITGDRSKISALDAKLRDLKNEYEEVFQNIKSSSPAYCTLIRPRACSLPEILFYVAGNDALVDYFIAGETIYIWYCDSSQFQGFSAHMTRHDLDGCLAAPGAGLNAMAEELLSSVLKRFNAPGHIIVIPHRELLLFPFSAASEASSRSITLSPSIASWLYSPGSRTPNPALLVICAPGEQGSPATATKNPEDLLTGGDFGGAPPAQARSEAEAIFPHFSPRILISGEAANEARLRETIQKASLIHFCTNCAIDEATPFFSGLVLDHELLRCGDFYGLDIQARCAVISQYRTLAIADSMGLDSIVRSLIHAGVQSVIINPIDIREEIRIAFWSEFYRDLKQGMGIREAFGLAQTASRERLPASNEWSFFTLIQRRTFQ